MDTTVFVRRFRDIEPRTADELNETPPSKGIIAGRKRLLVFDDICLWLQNNTQADPIEHTLLATGMATATNPASASSSDSVILHSSASGLGPAQRVFDFSHPPDSTSGGVRQRIRRPRAEQIRRMFLTARITLSAFLIRVETAIPDSEKPAFVCCLRSNVTISSVASDKQGVFKIIAAMLPVDHQTAYTQGLRKFDLHEYARVKEHVAFRCLFDPMLRIRLEQALGEGYRLFMQPVIDQWEESSMTYLLF
jgi:hypothetical protein